MEDEPCDVVSAEARENVNNGVVSTVVTTLQEDIESPAKEEAFKGFSNSKFNGDSNLENNIFEDEISSESDALVIDESIPKKPTHKRKKITKSKGSKKVVKDPEIITHSNPFFNESLYELAQQQQEQQTPPVQEIPTPLPIVNNERTDVIVNNCKVHKHRKGRNKSPKREYAQYLGLQPTVQFKCSKCGQAGFETLTALNNHIIQCDAIPSEQPAVQDSSSSSFKLKRKVFLCSACGTYYENWNLYLHMLELHRRFICLYCLGMFSAPNDLCQHIQSRHNLQPGHKNSLDEFFNVYSEPCYVVCCECNKLFSEEDNFFYHNCVKSGHGIINNKSNQKLPIKNKTPKVQIRPENHVTGDSGSPATVEMPLSIKNLDDENIDTNIVKPNAREESTSECEQTTVECEQTTVECEQTTLECEQTEIRCSSSLMENDNVTQNEEEVKVQDQKASDNSNNPDSVEKQNDDENQDVVKETVILTPNDCQDTERIINEDENSSHRSNQSMREIDSDDEQPEDFKEADSESRCSRDISPDLDQIDTSSHNSESHKVNSEEIEDIPSQDKLIEDVRDCHSPTEKDEDEYTLDIKASDENREDEDFVDNNEETDQFSENDLDYNEDNEVYSDRDESTDNLMDTSEKTRLDSSQDDAEIIEHSEPEHNSEDEPVETRKVPKLSLKLPKASIYQDETNNDSDDSEKLTMEVDQVESENETNMISGEKSIDETTQSNVESEYQQPNNASNDPQLQIAGADVGIVELQLEQPLDKFDVSVLLQKCLKATASTCVYCNHARKIAVNGKQLGLHAIAEHRYSAVVNSITAEELMPETFVVRIKENLDQLADVFFSLESGISGEGVTFSHVFECFQCRYSTTIHKELYLHNRKLHTKNLLLCIMCKSNFYSYSELICHLCPGVYILDYDIQFRCCMCVSDDLPSAFRLMVHLRKRHHVCDVCLELCHNQYKLSNHVWKHKLHHFCYRCGIAYRNKPDITRHLFWKHGTESVMCKKCLQKKWPHVYHFCVPPNIFTCDECNLTFSKAVSLKVHKRIHTDVKPHACTIDDCTDRFISKKLLLKHEIRHREPVEEEKIEPEEPSVAEDIVNEESEKNKEPLETETEKTETKIEEKPKLKVDVYDLPELNLSESDSDSDDETAKNNIEETACSSKANSEATKNDENILQLNLLDTVCHPNIIQEDNNLLENEIGKSSEFNFEPSEKVAPILENIWDDFKNYQAEKEKIDHMFIEKPEDKDDTFAAEKIAPTENELTSEVALLDHDYCVVSEPQIDTSITEVKPDLTQRVDHDYCSPKGQTITSPTKVDTDKMNEEPKPSPRKRSDSTSSNSSSSSDSSSCTCGSNCSCSSSSGTSSSTSDSSDSDSSTEEGRKKQQLKRERRKEKAKNKKAAEAKAAQGESETITVDQPRQPITVELPILESDLDTAESETDEEFYDKQPQKLAKKILEEKRNQLLAEVGTSSITDSLLETSRATTPSLPPEEEIKPKKKSKSKKKKKRKSERKIHEAQMSTAVKIPIAPITLTISRNSPIPSLSTVVSQQPIPYQKVTETATISRSDDSNTRASKRRRVPNKFYGYSSDEDSEKAHVPKWRKTESHPLPQSPLTVPPLTIKTSQLNPPPPAVVEPLTIRPAAQTGELRVLPRLAPPPRMPPPKPFIPVLPPQQMHQQIDESGSDSNESSAEENSLSISRTPEKPPQPQLYCYCRCPYDEVSEMIGCDSSDCAIEWFHFECVGIMVPPKGQWFCPDCRKKKQQKRELLQT